MKLVIDIPEEEYNIIKNYNGFMTWVERLIKNGIPLPKGHGDLIDVSRKITVSVYDDQYEEWGERTLTILEALNKWSDEGVTAKDIVIQADEESEDENES